MNIQKISLTNSVAFGSRSQAATQPKMREVSKPENNNNENEVSLGKIAAGGILTALALLGLIGLIKRGKSKPEVVIPKHMEPELRAFQRKIDHDKYIYDADRAVKTHERMKAERSTRNQKQIMYNNLFKRQKDGAYNARRAELVAQGLVSA